MDLELLRENYSPIQRYLYFVQERESIRYKKEEGKPKPWTTNPILQSYRFTNCRRMDDKVSQWLLANWYEPNFNHPNMLLAVALARFVNKPSSLAEVGFPKAWNPARIIRKLREYRDTGNAVFNAAYMVRGGLPNGSKDKIEAVVSCYIAPLRVVEENIDGSSMKDAWGEILASYGMGSFMAGQIVADLRHAKRGEWKDRLTWAPLGPGSKRGMNRLLGRPVTAPMKQAEFEKLLVELIQRHCQHLPYPLPRKMEAIDWQNTLCEYDKVERVLWGEGRPKQGYPGKAETNG